MPETPRLPDDMVALAWKALVGAVGGGIFLRFVARFFKIRTKEDIDEVRLVFDERHRMSEEQGQQVTALRAQLDESEKKRHEWADKYLVSREENTKLRNSIDMFEEQIRDLEETIRLRDAEIHRKANEVRFVTDLLNTIREENEKK